MRYAEADFTHIHRYTHKTRLSPLCFATPETCGAQRCFFHYVTFVRQPLIAKSWTKLEMSPKYVCWFSFSTKTAEITEHFSARERLG